MQSVRVRPLPRGWGSFEEIAKTIELLRTDVTMNMREASPERELDAPRVEIAGGMVEVSACGGRLRTPLPPGARELGELPSASR
ncbi:MAG: hypothetical protein R6X02_09135 [Enhygromyxa sp.]